MRWYETKWGGGVERYIIQRVVLRAAVRSVWW